MNQLIWGWSHVSMQFFTFRNLGVGCIWKKLYCYSMIGSGGYNSLLCYMYNEAMTHPEAAVGLSLVKQLSHTLTSFSIPNFGIRELLDEHLLQNICPHARQWCYNYTHINKYSPSTTYGIDMLNAFPEQSIIYSLFISVQCHATSYHGNMKCKLLLVSLQRGDILCISSQLVDADATSSVNQDFY